MPNIAWEETTKMKPFGRCFALFGIGVAWLPASAIPAMAQAITAPVEGGHIPVTTFAIIKDIVIPCITVFVASGAAIITIIIYHRNSNLRRAEWLYALFDRFFCQRTYTDIRRMLDYANEDQVYSLRDVLHSHSDERLEEKLVDYLNFFEFLASLWKLGQLPIEEIKMTFDYYIRRLGDYEFILEYLQEQGFEGLLQLVTEVRKTSVTK
jgi:hypothetical protein